MDNVRTVLPTSEGKPSVRLNLIKIAQDHIPLRLEEIKQERIDMEIRLQTLLNEERKLQQMLKIVAE